MGETRGYVRPMAGWWRRNPFVVRYMAREASALFVAAYALVLLWGLVRLGEGREAFEAWLLALASPASIALHVVLLAVFAFHTVSWFRIMPKTLPPIAVAGRRLSPGVVTGLGLAASAACSLALLAAAWALAA